MCQFSRNFGSFNVLEPYFYICIMHKCIYVCVLIYTYIYICAHTRTHTHTHIYIYMCACVCVCVCVWIIQSGEIFLNSVHSICPSTISATYSPFSVSSTLYRVYLKFLDEFQERISHNKIRKEVHFGRLSVHKYYSRYSPTTCRSRCLRLWGKINRRNRHTIG
jgi:hypothetical protein